LDIQRIEREVDRERGRKLGSRHETENTPYTSLPTRKKKLTTRGKDGTHSLAADHSINHRVLISQRRHSRGVALPMHV